MEFRLHNLSLLLIFFLFCYVFFNFTASYAFERIQYQDEFFIENTVFNSTRTSILSNSWSHSELLVLYKNTDFRISLDKNISLLMQIQYIPLDDNTSITEVFNQLIIGNQYDNDLYFERAGKYNITLAYLSSFQNNTQVPPFHKISDLSQNQTILFEIDLFMTFNRDIDQRLDYRIIVLVFLVVLVVEVGKYANLYGKMTSRFNVLSSRMKQNKFLLSLFQYSNQTTSKSVEYAFVFLLLFLLGFNFLPIYTLANFNPLLEITAIIAELLFMIPYFLMIFLVTHQVYSIETQDVAIIWSYPLQRRELWTIKTIILFKHLVIVNVKWFAVHSILRYSLLLEIHLNVLTLIPLLLLILLIATIQSILNTILYFIIKDRVISVLISIGMLVIIGLTTINSSVIPLFTSIPTITGGSGKFIGTLVLSAELMLVGIISMELYHRVEVSS